MKERPEIMSSLCKKPPRNPHKTLFCHRFQNPPPQGVPVRVRPSAPQAAQGKARKRSLTQWAGVAQSVAQRLNKAACLAFFATAANAQPYVGASIGSGATVAPSLTSIHPALNVQRDQNSPVGGLFIGQRFGWWGVEAGAFRMPVYQARVTTDDYKGYKGAAALPKDPDTADVTQRISGHALYLRGNVYAPKVYGFTPYAFAGVAQATNRNREDALYDGTDRATNDQTFRNRAPIFGLGLQKDYGRLILRAEYLRSDGLQDNSHTLKRRIELVTVGLAYRF